MISNPKDAKRDLIAFLLIGVAYQLVISLILIVLLYSYFQSKETEKYSCITDYRNQVHCTKENVY